mmetsp:Transcript_15788/g.26395  ORF Transcript_15788/g.26395 Transcript_15788/m.26395 type:complete len:123 (+) Transcript_15788:183-551(+)
MLVALLANHKGATSLPLPDSDNQSESSFISTSQRLSLIRDVFKTYLPTKQLMVESKFHLQVDRQLLIIPPPDIHGSGESWVRGPLASDELKKCQSSVYYYFQKHAVTMKNTSSDRDMCAISS